MTDWKNINIIHNKMINIRAFILHMSISRDKIFVLISKYLSLWLWPSLVLAIFGVFVVHKPILFDVSGSNWPYYCTYFVAGKPQTLSLGSGNSPPVQIKYVSIHVQAYIIHRKHAYIFTSRVFYSYISWENSFFIWLWNVWGGSSF